MAIALYDADKAKALAAVKTPASYTPNEIERVQDKIKQLQSGERTKKYIGLNN